MRKRVQPHPRAELQSKGGGEMGAVVDLGLTTPNKGWVDDASIASEQEGGFIDNKC